MLDLLDRAIAAYTGRDHPVDAWKHIITRGGAQEKVIGLKTNGLGGKGISTHLALVLAIAERLQQAGVKPGNILVWDRNARDLEACGLTINTDPARIRCYGSDVSGFEDQPVSWGTASVRLSKILTRECAMVINLPILKDHELSGVTFSMKNMYGVVQRPFELHANGCNPGVADLNCIPAIREKVRFTIGDAMSSVYQGGPSFHPEHLWYPNALVVGEDRVGPGSNGLADDRDQARRGRRAHAGGCGPAAALHRHGCRCAHMGWGPTIRSGSTWLRFSCSRCDQGGEP